MLCKQICKLIHFCAFCISKLYFFWHSFLLCVGTVGYWGWSGVLQPPEIVHSSMGGTVNQSSLPSSNSRWVLDLTYTRGGWTLISWAEWLTNGKAVGTQGRVSFLIRMPEQFCSLFPPGLVIYHLSLCELPHTLPIHFIFRLCQLHSSGFILGKAKLLSFVCYSPDSFRFTWHGSKAWGEVHYEQHWNDKKNLIKIAWMILLHSNTYIFSRFFSFKQQILLSYGYPVFIVRDIIQMVSCILIDVNPAFQHDLLGCRKVLSSLLVFTWTVWTLCVNQGNTTEIRVNTEQTHLLYYNTWKTCGLTIAQSSNSQYMQIDVFL